MRLIDEEVRIVESAMSGDVAAQLQYGKMLCGLADRVVLGLNGIEVVRYWEMSNEGMMWLGKAAESGSREAEELLLQIKKGEVHVVTEPEYLYKKAMRYISGEGVGKNLAKASEVLLDAADLDSMYKRPRSDAYRELAELCSRVEPKAYMFGEDPMKWLERLAVAGVGETQHMLACVYCGGTLNYYPVDREEYSKGLKWLRERADAGAREFQWQYGNVLIWAGGDLAGIEYLKKSYESGYADAAYSLGDFYACDADWDAGYFADEAKAIDWFKKAIELGSVEALHECRNLI